MLSFLSVSHCRPRILILNIPDALSHQFVFFKIHEELASRGHDVLHVLPDTNAGNWAKKGHNASAMDTAYYKFGDADAWHELKKGVFNRPPPRIFTVRLVSAFGHSFRHCRALLNDTATMERLQGFNADVILCDLFYACNHPLSDRLGDVPLVSLHTGAPLMPLYSSWWTGSGRQLFLPNALAYAPQLGTSFVHPMTFAERMQNSATYVLNALADRFLLRPVMLRSWREMGVDPTRPEAVERDALHLFTADWAIEPPRPIVPNVKYIGGVLVGPSGPLPPDLEEFMVSSGETGVVLASTGTVVILTPEQVRAMAEAFAALPARVLWKLTPGEAESLANVSVAGNIKIMNWMPQNDLLGHPRTRAFLSQCGANSLYEAAYHGVPIMALPGRVPDQGDSAAKAARLGFCLPVIIGKNFSAATVRDSLARLLSEPQFRRNAALVSRRMRARLRTPTQEAADWVEHVAEFGSYLRTPEAGMPWAAAKKAA
ncbi:hypothetical protein WJX81_000609 [Elliptochloris bilobata]|uniref:Glycosyltransferase n=1 Tax=Elliptochloris bilobata TaxID=381761 RepID=A0AAW1RNC2_9CHLO